MQVRLRKDIVDLLASIGVVDSPGVNEWIKGSITKSGEVGVVSTSTLDLIYANTQYIVESIKSRKAENGKKNGEVGAFKEFANGISPGQAIELNRAYESYIDMFNRERSWGTGDKDYRSTTVFKDPNPVIDELLHKALREYLLSLDIDYTIYGVEY